MGRRAVQFDQIPFRMNELWDWVVAIDAWDYCDSAPLALLVSGAPIPEELRASIADIVSGQRKQKRKGASKLKIPASERMRIAGCVSLCIGIADMFQFDALGEPGLKQGAESIAASKGIEPGELIASLAADREEIIQVAMGELGVSRKCIENLLRDFRKKVKNWPNI
jgi:hypothetical protein